MDQDRFDDLTRSWSRDCCRRAVLRGMVALGVGVFAGRGPEAAVGTKKRRKKKKNRGPIVLIAMSVAVSTYRAGTGVTVCPSGSRSAMESSSPAPP